MNDVLMCQLNFDEYANIENPYRYQRCYFKSNYDMMAKRWMSGAVEVPIKVFYCITKRACYETD